MKKHSKRYVIIALTVVLAALLVGRIIYVNVKLPHPDIKQVNQTDGFQSEYVTVRIRDAKLYSKEQWTKQAVQNRTAEEEAAAGEDYRIMMLQITVDNHMDDKVSGFTVASNMFLMSAYRATPAHVYFIDNQTYEKRSMGDIQPGETKEFTYIFVCLDWVTDDIYIDYYETGNNQRMKLAYGRAV